MFNSGLKIEFYKNHLLLHTVITLSPFLCFQGYLRPRFCPPLGLGRASVVPVSVRFALIVQISEHHACVCSLTEPEDGRSALTVHFQP